MQGEDPEGLVGGESDSCVVTRLMDDWDVIDAYLADRKDGVDPSIEDSTD